MEPSHLYQHIISSLCYDLGLEHSLKTILRNVKKFIPAEYIVIFAFNKEKRHDFQLMEISDSLETTDKINLHNIDMLEILRPYAIPLPGCEGGIYIIDDVTRVSALRNVFISSTGRGQRSLLILELAREGDTYFFVTFRAAQAGVYSQEHAEFVRELKPIFLTLFREVMRGNDEKALRRRLTSRPMSGDNLSLLEGCPGLVSVVRHINRVAIFDAPVLIRGETGVGKELVATAIHERSRRKGHPFVRVNCGAIPETLLDAEFFGYEKGAFTGAIAAHKGYFEQADGGTIFLDEVGELSPLAQVHLLRVLEAFEVHRIGSHRTIALDFRIVAATNRNLADMVENGSFRADLWYRLYGCSIDIPPLRRRVEDIPVLLQYFLAQMSINMGLDSPPSVKGTLLHDLFSRAWPGNIRELRNWAMRALIHSVGENSSVLLPPPEEREQLNIAKAAIHAILREDAPMTMREMEHFYIRWALDRCHGRIQGKNSAAELLKLNPATLRSRMRKLNIPFPTQMR